MATSIVFSGVTGILLPFLLELELGKNGRRLPDLYEAHLTELQAGLERGDFTSRRLVEAYISRIQEVNTEGPHLRAIIERGPLHGIPIILKDNIATRHSDGLNTTAGSYALLDAIAPRDAFVVQRLRNAGALFIAKSNMGEWADFRGWLFGWSARGEQATSPYFPNGDAESSSTGSAIATAIGLCAASIGTETDGSIVTTACRQNVVGIKPTVGLTSRAGVIPASEHQDSVGILARCVHDAAMILSVIAGPDPRDPYTLDQPSEVPNYPKYLKKTALHGVRLGVPRNIFENDTMSRTAPFITETSDNALDILRSLGATVTIVDCTDYPAADEIAARVTENIVMLTELKDGLERYMSDLVHVPTGVRTLKDLIVYNELHAELELPPGHEDQDRFKKAQSMPGFDKTYLEALSRNRWMGTEGSIDYVLKKYKLDALVMPSRGKTSAPAALAGYPIVSVPLGFLKDDSPIGNRDGPAFPAPGLPFGISFTGGAYTEAQLLSYAFAFEQRTRIRLQRRAFPEATPRTQL